MTMFIKIDKYKRFIKYYKQIIPLNKIKFWQDMVIFYIL